MSTGFEAFEVEGMTPPVPAREITTVTDTDTSREAEDEALTNARAFFGRDAGLAVVSVSAAATPSRWPSDKRCRVTVVISATYADQED